MSLPANISDKTKSIVSTPSWGSGSSPTCHRVLVERKMVAVDQSVYRIVCE